MNEHAIGRIIRMTSLPADAGKIEEVFSAAKAIMRTSGNASQWGDNYPSIEIVSPIFDA